MKRLQLLLTALAVLVAGTFAGVSDVGAQNNGECVRSCKEDCADLPKDESKDCKFSCMGGRCGIPGIIQAAQARGEPGIDCSADGVCNAFCESPADADCTEFPCTEQGIRDAIAAGGGPYTFACNGPTTVTTVDEIVIDNDVILDGEGNLTVDGNDDHRVLSVVPGATVELVGMTVSGGQLIFEGAEPGAGILNEGTLTIADSIVEWNYADAEGGGIYNSGTMAMVNSVVRDNTTGLVVDFEDRSGSGIYNAGTLTLLGSAVTGNVGWSSAVASAGMLALIDSQVSDNYSGDGAAISASGTLTLMNSAVFSDGAFEGIVSSGTTTVTNSTVTANWTWPAIVYGGGTLTLINSSVLNVGTYLTALIEIPGGADMVVSNSLILGISDEAATCSTTGSVTSWGGNIESPTNDCGLTDPTDLVNVSAEDLKLGPLADNGGPTMTYALLPGSVAIDWIPEAMCLDAAGDPLTTDQRGEERPVAIVGTEPKCDVGAFEVQP